MIDGPKFSPEEDVRLISQPDMAGRIIAPPRFIGGEYWYSIYFNPNNTSRHPEGDLEPFESTTNVGKIFTQGRYAGHEAFLKIITHLKLTTALRFQIYALEASRTHFYTYQYKPLLKFLDSPHHRLLIADEVGLGKTIEAGLILTEMRARRSLERVLIVPPSHLISKWQREMKSRFDLDFEILDRKQAEDFLRNYQENGEEAALLGIISLQTLRGKSLLERWEGFAPQLDMVIFDEAGRLRNRETLSHRIAATVSDTADAVLLLSATPVQIGDQDLFNLLKILEPDEFSNYEVARTRAQANEPILNTLRELRKIFPPDFDQCISILQKVEDFQYGRYYTNNPLYRDILEQLQSPQPCTRKRVLELQRDISNLNSLNYILSRTRKREVNEEKSERCPKVIKTDPTIKEQEFYRLVTADCLRNFRKKRGNPIASFSTMMPQRQMASCMVAMIDYVLERCKRNATDRNRNENSDLRVEDYEIDQINNGLPTSSREGLEDLEEWREILFKHDSKFNKLIEVLRGLEAAQPGGKILVFSYFKKTLDYLHKRLKEYNIPSLIISGDVPSLPNEPDKDIRGQRIEQFRDDPTIRVLLSTEVGSEGLDLQFCHVLINYDLPWNPMVVEQRIGRLDRIGQQANRILIFNFSMPGTIEDRILEKLYQRIKLFERSIGDLEEILGEQIRLLTQDLFSSELSSLEQERRIEQAAFVIENRRLELETFQEQATAFIGHDEYFLDEIGQAKDRRRFVGGEELLLYLEEFLSSHYPHAIIKETKNPQVYILHLPPDFRYFLQHTLGSEDVGLKMFFRRCGREDVHFTIASEVAERNGKIDFLTFYHPIIRSVTQYYGKNTSELHPVSQMKLNTRKIPSGLFAYFLYLTQITGARPVKDLEFVVISQKDKKPLSPDDCEWLLWEILSNAKSLSESERHRDLVHTHYLLKAEEILLSKLDEKFAHRKKFNQAYIASRLTSIEESFKRSCEKRQEMLDLAKVRNRQQRYIRMLEGGIRNLESQFEDKRREIEEGRTLNRSFELKGAGLLEVFHEP